MSSPEDAWNEVRKAVRLLERMKIPYVLGGSLASSVQGAPRSTNDADIVVAPFAGRENEFAAEYGEGYYVSVPSIVDANRRRSSFNIINTMVGFKVDLFVQKSREFDASVMARRQARFVPEGATEATAVLSVEDAILTNSNGIDSAVKFLSGSGGTSLRCWKLSGRGSIVSTWPSGRMRFT